MVGVCRSETNQRGMRTTCADGIAKAVEGKTTLEEVDRVAACAHM